MSARRMESAAVGGVTERDGKFYAFFEHHRPCLGGGHTGCTVIQHDEMQSCVTFDEAMKMLADVHREVGWESEHDT